MRSTSTRSYHRSDVQGLRAIAVIVVIGFHAGLPLPGGFVGVDIFFVISGFVITALLHREWLATEGIELRRFFKRRFQRLVPALAVLVSVTMVVSIFVLSPFGTQQSAALTGTGAMLFVANIAIVLNSGDYFSPNAANNPLLNTWSLSVEEQFYVVFPIVLLVAWLTSRKFRGKNSFPILIVGLITLASFLLAVIASTGWRPTPGAALVSFYSPVTRAWEFGVGALLYLGTQHVHRVSGWLVNLMSWVGLGLLVASVFLIDEKTPFPGVWTLLPVSATVLLIYAGQVSNAKVSRMLGSKPLTYIGDRSYSLYLWHWPLIVFAVLIWPNNFGAVAGALTASVFVSLLAYRIIENPLRSRSLYSGWKFASFVMVVTVPPIVLSQLLGFGARNDWGSERIATARNVVTDVRAYFKGECVDDSSIGGKNTRSLQACEFNVDADGDPIYLLGDSNSVIYSEALLEVASQLNRPLYIYAAALCPFIDIYRVSELGAAADKACRDNYTRTLETVINSGAGTVVIAQSSGYWYEDNLSIQPGTENSTDVKTSTSQTLIDGFDSTVQKLESAGLDVLLVTPNFQFDQPVSVERCSTFSLINESCPFTVPLSRANPDQITAKSDVTEFALSRDIPVVDTTEVQCPNDYCGAVVDRIPVYMDSSHMSPIALKLKKNDFVDAMG